LVITTQRGILMSVFRASIIAQQILLRLLYIKNAIMFFRLFSRLYEQTIIRSS